MQLHVNIGTHEVTAHPIGETLRFCFTWHEPVLVHAWTLGSIDRAARGAECDDDYVAAERRFIEALGGGAVPRF